MATTAASNQQGADRPGAEPPQPPVRKRAARRWLTLLLSILVLFAAAPTLVTKTPLRNVVLAAALRSSSHDVQVSLGSLSAGWLSTISAGDLVVRQNEGKLEVEVPNLSIDRTLFALLLNHRDLGQIKLERPIIKLELPEDRRDAKQELAAELPKVQQEPAKVSLDLEVVDGTVIVHDPRRDRDWKFEQLSADLRSPRDVDQGGASGPAWQTMTGQVQFTTPGGNFQGFVTGPAQFEAQLADGVVHMSPFVVDVSGGKLSLAPRLQLKEPRLLEMDAGRVVDHVHVTQEMCDAWLKFALPVLAEVTQVEGEFSIDLEGLRVPLASPQTGETAGKIGVHSIQLGPGPLVEQFLPIIDKLRKIANADAEQRPRGTLNIARESDVEFRLVDGRVFHHGLRLELPNMTLETSGSVGFDESLAMMAEISLSDRLRGNGPLAELLSQPLQVPISGTLKKPKVDMPELRSLNREALRDTARGVLRNELKRGLDRLLKPKDE